MNTTPNEIELKQLENSINHALKRLDKKKIFACEQEFVLSGRAARLARNVIGRHPRAGEDGCFNGSPLHLAILSAIAKTDVTPGDWIWNAVAKAYGVTDAEICERPRGYISARLPKYARND